jgi:plasmid stabilization system protein ParE
MPRLEIHRLADLEINEAAAYYEEQAVGLGVDFLDEVESCFASVAEYPMGGPEIVAGVRRRLLRRFPYGVLYSLRGESVRVLAMMHLKREPSYWVGRE